MEEIWRDIEGYEGLYQVSNLGRVKSLERIDNNNHLVKERILKQYLTNRGYLKVIIWKNHKSKNNYVHRLVAQAFIPNPHNKPQIDHIDCNKENNSVANLRWCTASENMRNEITYSNNIESHNQAKMVVICTDLDGNFIKQYDSVTDVKRDGHSVGIVSMVCRGLLNKHHNMLWEYAS